MVLSPAITAGASTGAGASTDVLVEAMATATKDVVGKNSRKKDVGHLSVSVEGLVWQTVAMSASKQTVIG